MRRIALTGGIGAGKSTVSRLLAEHGAVIVDSDALAREVVEPGTEGLAEIVEVFGQEVLHADGTLDRPALGKIVFTDPALLQRLNAITHPRIQEKSARLIASAEASGAPVLIHDIPLLVENGLPEAFGDGVIVVEAPAELRLARLEERGLPRDQAEERMKAQASDEERRAAATYLIDNSGSLEGLREQVDEVWDRVTG